MAKTPNQPEDNSGAKNLPLTIHAQYIKDLSFESPIAPDVFLRNNQGAPNISINFSLDASPVEHDSIKNMYEVVMSVQIITSRGELPVFVMEMDYGAAVSIGNSISEDMHHPMVFIEVPRLLFPYIREIIGSTTSNGGFPPVMLTPVDFHSMYVDRFKDEIESARIAAEEAAKSKETIN